MITVNNGTASAQAIARGATRVGTGSTPRAIRASISSLRTIEPSSAASPAPIRLATSRPARTGPISTRTATARKLGKVDSAPCCDQQPMRLEPGHQPHAQPGAQHDRQASHGDLLELPDHLARMPDDPRPGSPRRPGPRTRRSPSSREPARTLGPHRRLPSGSSPDGASSRRSIPSTSPCDIILWIGRPGAEPGRSAGAASTDDLPRAIPRRRIAVDMDPYSILGVPRGCTREEVKEAFRSLVHRAHPDRGGDGEAFIQLCDAYREVLDELDRGADPDGRGACAARSGRRAAADPDPRDDLRRLAPAGLGGIRAAATRPVVEEASADREGLAPRRPDRALRCPGSSASPAGLRPEVNPLTGSPGRRSDGPVRRCTVGQAETRRVQGAPPFGSATWIGPFEGRWPSKADLSEQESSGGCRY